MAFAYNVLDERVALIAGGATGIGFGIGNAGEKLVIASRNS